MTAAANLRNLENLNRSAAEDAFDEAVRKRPEAAARAEQLLREMLVQSEIMFGQTPLPVSLKPHFVRKSLHRVWVQRVEALHRALEHLGALLLEDRDLYSTLGLPEAARALVELDPGYKQIAVVCRPDIAWQGERISLYEINADSPAMMTFTDHVQNAVRSSFPSEELFARFHASLSNRTQSLLYALLTCYHEWGGTEASPTIAVIDWPNQKTAREQERTARDFTRLGCPSFTCHPHELEIRGGKLVARGRTIDIVQRRVLFPDFITRASELEVLLRAYRERTACVVNPLRSYLLGNKTVLALLAGTKVTAMLPAETRAAVADIIIPSVIVRSPGGAIARDRAGWVLKGAFSYGGKEVVIGSAVDQETWERALDASAGALTIAQEYRPPPRYAIPTFSTSGAVDFQPRFANWAPFVFGGRFAGGMTRVSGSLIVSITAAGALLPTIPSD